MAHPTFIIKRVYLAMRKCMDESLQPLGLTAAQFDVIQQLLHEDGLEHRIMQERLVVSSPTLTNIIDVMVDRGLVERRISSEDARVKLLFLTPKAHELHDQMGAAGEHFVSMMFAGFTANERGMLLDWVERITHNLETNSRS